MNWPLLSIVVWLPIIGGVLVMLIGSNRATLAKQVALAASILLGGVMMRDLEWSHARGAPISVALIQGNIPQSLKFEPSQYASTLSTYRRLIESADAKLTILPETAIPRFLDLVDPAYLESLVDLARKRQADILAGAPYRNERGEYFNGVVNLGQSGLQFAAKTHLVPLGEFVPPEFKWILGVLRIPLSDFTAGTGTRLTRLASGSISRTAAMPASMVRRVPPLSCSCTRVDDRRRCTQRRATGTSLPT